MSRSALIGQFESEHVSIRGLRLAKSMLHGNDSYTTYNVVSVYEEPFGVTKINLKLRGLIRSCWDGLVGQLRCWGFDFTFSGDLKLLSVETVNSGVCNVWPS